MPGQRRRAALYARAAVACAIAVPAAHGAAPTFPDPVYHDLRYDNDFT